MTIPPGLFYGLLFGLLTGLAMLTDGFGLAKPSRLQSQPHLTQVKFALLVGGLLGFAAGMGLAAIPLR